MHSFLLEIGTEELPADFALSCLPQLREMVSIDLAKRNLHHGQVHTTSTPRRLVIRVSDLSTFSKDLIVEKKGPPASKAFVDGNPSQSAVGFAKRLNIDINTLFIRETDKGPFVFGKEVQKGEAAKIILSELVPIWIKNIQGKRFMRWATGEIRFARPIRWLLSLLDDELISLSLPDSDPTIVSSKFTRGHRLSSTPLQIKSADQYEQALSKAGVIVDRSIRKNIISQLIEKKCLEMDAVPDISNQLLDELTDLVENPLLIVGEFDKSFLKLPIEVLTTVMKVHQRYIPIFHKNAQNDPLSLCSEGNLLPNFLCISNGSPLSAEKIIEGNQKVLRARLSDAEFFVKADLATNSNDRNKQLQDVTFAKNLGNLSDRIERIKWITKSLCNELNFSDSDTLKAIRSAHFCKHDLVSHMVYEFPELQGIIGAKYLLEEGESKDVSLAVLEHYFPKYAGADLPLSKLGSLLALSERFELLLSIFALNERPSGSSDPYALRRAGNGIIQILWHMKWKIDLNQFLENSLFHWSKLLPNLHLKLDIILADLCIFFRHRIQSILEEFDYDMDIIKSVAGDTIPLPKLLVDPSDLRARVDLLVEMRKSGKLSIIQKVVSRASKLAIKSSLEENVISSEGCVDSTLFEKKSEFQMLDIINSIEPIAKLNTLQSYSSLLEVLATGSIILSSFFDGEDSVMVMTEDEDIKNNRLNMLRILCNQSSIIADFNMLNN